MSSIFYTSKDVSRRKNYQYVITRLRNSNRCLIIFIKKIQKQPKNMFLKVSQTSQENTCVGEFFKQSCRPSVCKLFRKRLQNKCFPMKFGKLLRTPILKNICKRLLLEVVYKKAVLKNFAIFIRRKQLVIKCSVKKMFLVVDRAVKVTCFYIEQHLL